MSDRADGPGYEALLFDMDGVLIRGRATLPAMYERVAADALDALGADVPAAERDPTIEGYRRRKPDPHYIERALDRLGVEHALYVGDRRKDIVAALRAGIEGALLRRAFNQDVTLDDSTRAFDGLEDLRTLFDG